jgi:hypothetical protein
MDELDAWVEVNDQIQRLEQQLELAKQRRGELAKLLFELNGPRHVYQVGDQQYLVLSTKVGSYYMAPRNKWAKHSKPVLKKAIVGGKVVEVPREPRPVVPSRVLPNDLDEVFRILKL